jgi:hypothetical protein
MKNAIASLRTPGTPSQGKARRPRSRVDVVRTQFTEHLENRLLFATYNALGDFSTTANPNGAWSYGELINGTFTADTSFTGGQWAGAGTTNTSSVGTNVNALGLVLKPGQAGASADLRWTAPADGTYNITGSFADFTGNASDDVRLFLNGVSLTTGTVGAGGTSSVPITQDSISVHAGNTVDFVVGPGSDGWDTNDQVSVQATITSTSDTGGTTSTSPLQATVSGKLPTKTLVSGERVTPAFYQRVTLANNGTTTVTGPVTIELVAATTQAGESGDPSIASVSRRVNLRPGRSVRFPVLVRSLPPNVTGDFYVVANVTDPTGITTTGASASTIAVRAAFVDLTGAFRSSPRTVVPGRRILLPVLVTNAGNIQAKGSLDIDVVASSSDATVDLGTVTKRIVINPARRQAVLLVEVTPTSMPAGTYTLTGTVDPNHVFNDTTVTNNTFTSAIPLMIR